MPSPIGHALGGIAAGAAVSGRADWRTLALFAVVGASADIDFLLPIPHRGPTHGLGAAVLVFLAAWLALAIRRREARTSSVHFALALGAAYASHTLLDWFGADSSTPQGLMALWPVTTTYYISGLDVFNSVNRRYWMPGFWRGNTITALRELVIMGPVAGICVSAVRPFRSYRRREPAPPRA